MLFNSLAFLLLFMPVVLGVALRLRGQALLGWICIASAVFYAFAGHVWFLVPMAVTTALDFWVGLQLDKPGTKSRRAYLVLSLACNLGLLAYFKYSGLLMDTYEHVAVALGASPRSMLASTLRVILPAGISFYTFQTMSYVIDIYRRQAQAERNFFAYLAFVSFFPHLVAGPLTRHNQLIPQLERIAERRINPRWWAGISLFSVGLIKKVLIADRIGTFLDPLLEDAGHLGLVASWLGAVAYGMQLYFDFSGYSDMAIGLGRLFDIDLPQNFDSPYKAVSPSDFWRRWHVTLSRWLRDYLYISLGGNRDGSWRTTRNLMLTMLLGGLWHGANWTFVVWGAYHGLLLVVFRPFGASWEKIPLFVQRAVTFVLVMVGWVFFRAPHVSVAVSWCYGLIGGHGVRAALDYIHIPRLVAFTGIGTAIALLLPNAYELKWDKLPPVRRLALGLGTAAAVIMMNYSSKFLYFQF